MKRMIFLILAIITFSSAAFAERTAVVFAEMEKDDSDNTNIEETLSVATMKTLMESAYNKIYWLTNAEATRDNFFETLQTAVNQSTTVDLYILAHGGMQYFWGHFDDRIYTDDILSLSALPNMNNLRMVFVGTCHGWDLTDEFLEVGAKAAIGCEQTMDNFPFLLIFLNDFINLEKTVGASTRDGAGSLNKPFLVNGNQDIYINSDN